MQITKSAGGIVVNKKSQVLVVNQNNNSWSLPKGHIEIGETPLMAAKREIFEESGIQQLTFISDLGAYVRFRIGLGKPEDKTQKKKIHMFLFSTEEMKLSPKDPLNPEARWVDKEKVTELLTHEKDKEFYLKWLDAEVE